MPSSALTVTRFEHRSHPVASRRKFARHMLRAIGLWMLLTLAGLAIGMAGYAYFEDLSLTDSFVNAAMILSTQSLDELRRSELLDVILETAATKIFLANPDMDRDLYRKQFHLNETETALIAGLIPKQQFLIKTPELAKVANLNVDPKSYWLYTNDPYDNRKRREAFEAFGFAKGLEVLAGGQP